MCSSTTRVQRDLPVSTDAPALAREFLRSYACPEHHAALLDDAVLMVSELVTNSVLHGGAPVVVAIDCEDGALTVRVRDGSTDGPAPRAASPTDEHGRGIALVAAMSDSWGVEPDDDGKHVWFVLN